MKNLYMGFFNCSQKANCLNYRNQNWFNEKKIILITFILFSFSLVKAQCTNATYGLYPATAYTNASCNGTFGTITSAGYDSEYSLVNVVSGNTYNFRSYRVSNSASRFITITNNSNNAVITSGTTTSTTSISWVANFTGQVRFYSHTGTGCGAGTNSIYRMVSCTAGLCTPTGNPLTYGAGSWIGYVYNSASAGVFTSYQGYVTEATTFNRVHSVPTGATSVHCSTNQDLFAIRYRNTTNLAAGYYTFTVGGDDGVRFSIDGGANWLINQWVDQGYTTTSNTVPVYLSGNTNMVLEYYENGGGSQSSFSYTFTPACSGTPTPGSTLTSSTSVLTGSTVNLSLQNATTPATYQWQSSSSSTGPWTNISGATSATYTATVTANTYYQCVVTCTASSTSATSNPVQVTLITPPVNDACANAIALPCGISNLAGTTVNAVSETAPLAYSSPYGVWYSFIGDGQSTTISSTAVFDHEMTIMTGTSCGSYVSVSSQDVALSNGTETYTFNSTLGTQYYVYIAHFSTTSTITGTFTISRTCGSPWTDTWVSMNTGSSNWCAGETRTISVTVTNTGSSTWTNATPDINIGVKWNAEADYFIRTDANNLAPGATQTYNLTVTAPMTAGTNNLTFDIVNEANFWFANNTNGGGPGNTVYTSPTITINNSPIVNAGIDQTICVGQNASLNGSVLSNSTTSSSPGTSIPDVDPLGASTTIVISGAAVDASQISGVTVNITHTWDSDLSLTLIAPNGSSIDLSSGNGGSGDNYTNTYFTNSGTAITSGTAPFNGSFMPEAAFSLLTGSANGTWTLVAIDNASGDIGTINSWSITYGAAAPSATYSWSPSATLSNALIASPLATPTITTSYTLTGTLNGCSSTDVVVVTLPTAGSSLAQDNENATCVVNQNGWVHFYHSSGRLIASVNSQGQDLGAVTATSYVEGSPVSVDACASSNPIFTTSVMGRHWVITPTIEPSSAVLIRLPYENSEFSSLSAAASTNVNPNDDLLTMSDLGLSKYSNGTNTNVNDIATDNCGVGVTTFHTQQGNGITSSYSNVVASYSDFSIPGFSEFWLHGSDQSSPLPVELINFQANCAEVGKVDVTWTTASEHNSSIFTVEKSRDGNNWNFITTVEGAGNSTQTINYSIQDHTAATGINYYRLTQTDFDGATESFNIVSANCSENSINSTMNIYPNPNNGDFYLEFSSEEIFGQAAVIISDARGLVVLNKSIELSQGSNVVHIDGLSISSGIYYVFISNGSSKSNTIKFSSN